MIEYLKEILYLLGEYRQKLPVLFTIFISVSILDFIGVGLIYPFLSIIMDPDYINSGYLSQIIAYLNLSTDNNKIPIYLGILLVFLFLVKSIAGVWLNWRILSFGQKQQIRLRSMLMKHYQNMPYRNYIDRNSSDFIYTIQTLTVQYANGVLTNLLKFFSEIIVILSLVFLLIYTNGPILIVVILFFAGLIFLYDELLGKRNQRYGKDANIAAIKVGQGIMEGMLGFKEVRILNKEKYFYDMVRNNSIIYSDNNLKQSIISTSPRYLIEFIVITLVVGFIVGPLSFGTDISKIIPSLGMFGLAAMRLMPSMNIISGNLTKLRYSRDAVSRLCDEISDIDLNKFKSKAKQFKDLGPFKSLELRNVSYKYTDKLKLVLNDISLTISRGETIGFIGESGSGKTTLIDVVTGLLTPSSGSIYYNHKLTKNLLEPWKEKLAYLPQNIFLLDNSIKNNITLEQTCTDELKLKKAIKDSKLSDLVFELPAGIDTEIGERGMQLSGGQRQRIALARALYHDREILVMDESTSALDNETEKEIIQEIDSLKGKKTILIIAHRLGTLRNCDRVFKLTNGKIELCSNLVF
jgi:ATP-binding cassette, subfamily B, bacterial PglK